MREFEIIQSSDNEKLKISTGGGGASDAPSYANLLAQRDELLEALEGLLRVYQSQYRETLKEEVAAEYAIAKVRRQK